MNALVLIISSMLLLAAVSVWLWTRHKLVKLDRKIDNCVINVGDDLNLKSELNALKSGSIGLGERILSLEEKLLDSKARIEQLELYSGGNSAYAEAIKLVKRGSDANELVKVCGLSQSEADLLVLMHKNKDDSAAVH